MEVHEYMYSIPDPKASNNSIIKCRYCDAIVATSTFAVISDSLEFIERKSTVHLMACEKFGQARKLEIEEFC